MSPDTFMWSMTPRLPSIGWQPIRLAHSRGFKSHELNAIRTIIEDNEAEFQESWDDYFAG